MKRQRTNELRHSAKEREKLQNIAKAYFKNGEMLHDKVENQIFKFELERDYHIVATTPERFSLHKNKLKIRF
jgi:hypothetical protein